jgi:hypothetical protein
VFDVVLGMDWLARFEASIVCEQRKVCLTTPDGRQIIVYGDKAVRVPGVILMMKAEKYMRRGCQAYLAYVFEKKAKLRELRDVSVVCDFPDMFLDDLSGVPLDREIEFKLTYCRELSPSPKYRTDWLRLK